MPVGSLDLGVMSRFSATTILTTIVLSLFCFVNLVKCWRRKKDLKLPPGPPQLPVIGNLLHFLVPSLPHNNVTNLAKKYGPVMHIQIGKLCGIVISSAEVANDVFKTKEISFAQRPNVFYFGESPLLGIAWSQYGGYWRQIRKICVLELLSMKRVHSFKSIREDEVWGLVDFIASNEGCSIDLTLKIQSTMNNIISRAAFGKQYRGKDEFLASLTKAENLAPLVGLSRHYPCLRFLFYFLESAFKRNKQRMKNIVQDIINERKLTRKAQASEDASNLIDVLLMLQESDDVQRHLTPKDIETLILDIYAGSETTSTTIAWAISELVKNPRVMKKAQEEVRQKLNNKTRIEEKDIENLDYLKLIIKETLRLHPPTPLMPREVREDIEIKGYHIPINSVILFNLWSISRDPKIWEESDHFKPERFEGSEMEFKGTSFGYTPFGAGRRMCPGISFATPIVELILAQMLYHFDWRISGSIKNVELDMSEAYALVVHKKHNLCLIPTIRFPFI